MENNTQPHSAILISITIALLSTTFAVVLLFVTFFLLTENSHYKQTLEKAYNYSEKIEMQTDELYEEYENLEGYLMTLCEKHTGRYSLSEDQFYWIYYLHDTVNCPEDFEAYVGNIIYEFDGSKDMEDYVTVINYDSIPMLDRVKLMDMISNVESINEEIEFTIKQHS